MRSEPPDLSNDAPASSRRRFQSGETYFFLTLRVFFAVFFTALFAFFFAFLAILPSDLRWLRRCVHSGIEMHFIPNTPTHRKKQRPA
jgi:hypothetical protein